jgi:hypothetical protein
MNYAFFWLMTMKILIHENVKSKIKCLEQLMFPLSIGLMRKLAP